jgi:hypothetical protein
MKKFFVTLGIIIGILIMAFISLTIYFGIQPSTPTIDKHHKKTAKALNVKKKQKVKSLKNSSRKHSTTITIPSFAVVSEKTLDTRIKTQVDQRIWAKDHIKLKYLRALLKHQYKRIEKRGGYEYHNNPTNVFIYIYDSKQRAKSGGTGWVAASMKGYRDNVPVIKFHKNLIKLHKQPPTEKFGFTVSKRKRIFKDRATAEDRATNEAMKRIPVDLSKPKQVWSEDLKEQVSLEDSLTEKYYQQVMNKYNITRAQFDSIMVEGVVKHWPLLK